MYYSFCHRAPKQVFRGIALKLSFDSKEGSCFCFVVVGSSAGSGAQSPSTEDGLGGPLATQNTEPVSKATGQREIGVHIFVVKFLIQTHIKLVSFLCNLLLAWREV